LVETNLEDENGWHRVPTIGQPHESRLPAPHSDDLG